MASGPPGVQTAAGPSMSTDSEYPHPDIILPPQSFSKLFCQTSLPAVVRQAMLPLEVVTHRWSPATVGVQRAPS